MVRVFSKEKFLSDAENRDWLAREPLRLYKGEWTTWVDICDGRAVVNGRIDCGNGLSFTSHPDWEIEIDDSREGVA